MKKNLLLLVLLLAVVGSSAQQVLKITNGATITIQNGTELTLQGGITLDNGSNLTNNGVLRLKNNPIANGSDWTDNSVDGALSGTGIVIFNSNNIHNFFGPTNFYAVQMNAGGLSLNDNFRVSNLLHLINGKISTGFNYVFLNNNSAASLLNDASNTNYINCWINGYFRRLIAINTNVYDFPVGNATRSNLLQFINNNITGTNYLTASFGTKQGTDAGLNVAENGNTYTAVNNGGVWYLLPNGSAPGGNYALQLYFNGFTGLADNQFGILRRPYASSDAADWIVPPGSSLEANNGAGRKVSDGFARRINISEFSQFGIGTFSTTATVECNITGASELCNGSTNNIYNGPAGMSSYSWSISGNGSITSSLTGSSVTVTAGASGSFTLTLNTTLNGAPAQCTKTVTVSSTPVCDITGSAEVCSNSINNTYSGPANMSTYSWTISSGGTIVGSVSGQSVNVTAGAPGSFTLTLDATANGCASHCTKAVTVKPNPACSITGSSTVTTGSTGNNYSGPAAMNSYSWNISGNGTITGSLTASSVTVTAGAAGSYILTLTTTLNGCGTTCTKEVSVNPITATECIVSGAAEVCSNSTNDIYNGPAGMSSYSWSINGNGTIIGAINNPSVNITAGAAGNYSLTLQTTLNGSPCSYTKTVIVNSCVSACSYTQGFYGNKNGKACYNNGTASTVSSAQLMLNAFGATTSKVFGNTGNKRFFTLYSSDITNGNIFKMLPGSGNSQAIAVDNVLPYDGAYYSNQSTWYLVPILTSGNQKGKINNQLLSQTISLWFNLRTSNALGTIDLSNDTLVTIAQRSCGSGIPIGNPAKYGLPHNVVLYLNNGNGYTNDVNGLFQLANDILGGVNTSINASDVQNAVAKINEAFDGCRILTGTIAYTEPALITKISHEVKAEVKAVPEVTTGKLLVTAYPNPYDKQFNLSIISPVSGMATIDFLTVNGAKIYQTRKYVAANTITMVPYKGPYPVVTVLYSVNIENYRSGGFVIHQK